MKYIGLIILFVLVFENLLVAQTKSDKLTAPVLPPLEKVLGFSANNSYLVKEQEAMSQHFGQSLEITKKLWMDKFFVDLGAQRSNNGAPY